MIILKIKGQSSEVYPPPLKLRIDLKRKQCDISPAPITLTIPITSLEEIVPPPAKRPPCIIDKGDEIASTAPQKSSCQTASTPPKRPTRLCTTQSTSERKVTKCSHQSYPKPTKTEIFCKMGIYNRGYTTIYCHWHLLFNHT